MKKISWWKKFIIRTAQAFFVVLVNAEPEVREEAKPYALKILESIKIAYAGDPDFENL